MTRTAFTVQEVYARSLHAHLAGEENAGLERAYDLGQKALDEGRNPAELMQFHEAAVASFTCSEQSPEIRSRAAELAAAFLQEALCSLEAGRPRGVYPERSKPSRNGPVEEGAPPPAPATKLETSERITGRRLPLQPQFWHGEILPENADLEERMKAQANELKCVTENLQAEIRQRQQMEDSLRHMERETGDFFASAPVGFHWMALDGTILDVNQTESLLLGCEREALIGRNLAEFLPDRQAFDELLQRLARQETIRDCEVKLRCRDGAIKYALIDANVFLQGDQLVHFRCFVRDITERKQAEEVLRRANDELELWVQQRTAELVRNNETLQAEIQQRRQVEEAILESEKRYRLIVETAEEGIWVMDAENRTTFVNRKLAELLGYRANAMLGRSLFDFMDEAGRAIAGATAAHGWQGEAHQRDFKFQRHDGTELWAQLATSAIIDDEGRYVGALAMVTDVTQRKQAEEALRKSEGHHRELFHQACLMQEKLRNLSNRILFAQEEERKRISRELHDEVGQALTAINVNLSMLKRETSQKHIASARTIEDTKSLLEKTMTNVHRFARELRPAMLDDLGLIPALRSYMKDFGERTGIAVHLSADAGDEDLDGDQKTVLYRVAQESLNNIAKHAQARQVEVTFHSDHDAVRMEIQDDGHGFLLDAQTAGKESKRLGLLGMEERVRLVNGAFSVESTPGSGTRVRVRLPVRTGLKPALEEA